MGQCSRLWKFSTLLNHRTRILLARGYPQASRAQTLNTLPFMIYLTLIFVPARKNLSFHGFVIILAQKWRRLICPSLSGSASFLTFASNSSDKPSPSAPTSASNSASAINGFPLLTKSIASCNSAGSNVGASLTACLNSSSVH